MSVCWLVVRDGREHYHSASLVSALEMLPEPDGVVTIDDADHTLGFGGAVAEGWRRVLATGADWCFHIEADFLFAEPVPLERMIGVLERHSHLTQMSLLRQPVNSEEKAAGGIVHLHPDDYVEQTDGQDVWTETKRFVYTTNPSVYSTELCKLGWPDGEASEGVFSARLLQANPDARCGIWGHKWNRPRVIHVGDIRAGHGY